MDFRLFGKIAIIAADFWIYLNKSDDMLSEGKFGGIDPRTEPYPSYKDTISLPVIYTIAASAKLMLADGNVSDEELAVVSKILDDNKFDEESKEEAMSVFKDSMNSKKTFEDIAIAFSQAYTEQDTREDFFKALLLLARADNDFSETEKRKLSSAARILKLDCEKLVY